MPSLKSFLLTGALLLSASSGWAASTPDSLVVTGPNLAQVAVGSLLVTVGNSQQALSAAVAGSVAATYYFTGTPAATNQVFFVAPRAMLITGITEVHGVAAGGTSTLTVTKETGTTAAGSGTAVQTGSFNLNATANTPQNATLSATTATITLAAGDRLSVAYANTIQSTAGLVVTVEMSPQ